MRLTSFSFREYQSIGVIEEGHVVDVGGFAHGLLGRVSPYAAHGRGWIHGWLPLLESGAYCQDALKRHIASRDCNNFDVRDVELLSPIARPRKIVAVGMNYSDHAAETGRARSTEPRLLGIFASSVTGHGQGIRIPSQARKIDFEAELAVVIGRRAFAVDVQDAMACVSGYMVANDISAREYQFDISPPQTTRAKSFDGFTPMGPWLTSADAIPDPQALSVRCWVNEALMQDGHTSQMTFPVRDLIAFISRQVTLEPGDVILTGTPAGCGAFRNPPVYLEAGDRVRVEIESLGQLENFLI